MTPTIDPDASVLAKIIVGITLGLPRDQAAQAVQVKPGTLRRWMLESEGVYEQIVAAEVEFDAKHLTSLNDMAFDPDTPKSVRANISEWALERHSPATWGRTSRNDMWMMEQQVKELVEEMKREGYTGVTEAQVMKDLIAAKRKALPDGKKLA